MEALSSPTPVSSPARKRRGSLLRWILALGVVAAWMLYSMMPETAGEQARRVLLAKLSAHYAELEVSIGSGRLIPGQGIVLQDICLRQPTGQGESVPLVTIAKVVAETDLDLERWAGGGPPLSARRVWISGLEAQVWSDSDGRFSIEQLLPLPVLGPGCPLVMIRDSRIRLQRDSGQSSPAIQWNDVNITIRKKAADDGLVASYHVSAAASSSYCDRLDCQAWIDDGGWRIEGDARGLFFDAVRWQRLPARLASMLDNCEGLSCNADARFFAEQRKDLNEAVHWEVQIRVRDGQLQHPQLPLIAQHLEGELLATPSGFQVEKLSAMIDGAPCHVSGHVGGWKWPCDLELQVNASDLLLTGRMSDALPETLRQQWLRFQPSGRIDVGAKLRHVRQHWTTSATIRAKGVDVEFSDFPYPVRDLNGTLHYAEGFIWSRELYGLVGGQSLRCDLRLSPPGSGQPQWFQAAVDGTIAIDETLFKALTPKHELPSELESFVRSLAPAGGIRLRKFDYRVDANGHRQRELEMEVRDGQLRYADFPYPLYGVNGRIVVRNETTRLLDFVAEKGDTGRITCNGRFEDAAAGLSMQLMFSGEQVPLDLRLREALPPEQRRFWDAFSPSGALDQFRFELSQSTTDRSPQFEIELKLDSPSSNAQQFVSVRSPHFPYRLDLIRGSIRYREGTVTLHDVEGRHETTRLIANGSCSQRADNRWQLGLDLLSGSRIAVDQELLLCIPADLQQVCQKIQLRGPVGVRGTTRVLLPDDHQSAPEVDYQVSLQLEGNRIGDAGPIRDIRGELNIRGRHQNGTAEADGQVLIDSMHYDGLQLTGIRGPFSIRNRQLLLGARNVALDPDKDFVPISGHIFDGFFGLAGRISLITGQYDLLLTLDDASVPTLLADFHQHPSDLTGQLSGQLRIEGAIGASHLIRGEGKAELKGANLYQLPLIMQFLAQLRVRPGEDVAFTDGTAIFSLNGDQLQFSQLQLWGDIIALHGTGIVNRLRDLDLTFNARVSPHNVWSRVTQPLGGQRYTLWRMHVTGNLDAPIIERGALDAVSDTLERLFPGMGRDAFPLAREPNASKRAEPPRR